MKISGQTIRELKDILKEEFNLELSKANLNNFAYSLVGYFDLLQKVDSRHKFGNSPAVPIDRNPDIKLDKREGVK